MSTHSPAHTNAATPSEEPPWRLDPKRRLHDGLYFFNRPESAHGARRNSSTADNDENMRLGLESGSSHAATEEFISEIRRQVLKGYAFVPFIGAGFSISAGNPIIKQLKEYLCRCICVALGVEDDASGTKELWNPRTDRWPPLIDKHRRATDPERWLNLVHTRYRKEYHAWTPRDPTNPELFLEAYGAMADWRTSLTFLSRLVPGGPRANRQPPVLPVLGAPSQDVVDACLRELMRDKHPSLNHTMLAALSHLLRIDTILTTNFDDLIERAFTASRNTLQVLDVHLNDSLPVLSAVAGKRCIIKLHGSLRSLRADYSLDVEPSADDKQRFVEYFAGRELHPTAEAAFQYAETNAHILVFGCGGKEKRTLGFFTHALKTFRDLRIYWICYSEREVRDVQRFARSLLDQEAHKKNSNKQTNKSRAYESPDVYIEGNGNEPRIFALRHTDAGLLLLHLYQSIRKSVPPSEAIFPSPARLSVPPLPIDHYSRQEGSWTSRLVEAEVRQFKAKLRDKLDERGLVIAVSERLDPDKQGDSDVPGVTSFCAELFRERESSHLCIWIEMNDIYDVDHLFETFQEAAHYRLGSNDWTPLYKLTDERPRRDEIRRLVSASSDPWILFINAREIPGSNHNATQRNSYSPSIESSEPSAEDGVADNPNGWLDDPVNIPKLRDLLNDFHNEGVDPVKVVLLCRDASRYGGPISPLLQTMRSPENLVVSLSAKAYSERGARRPSVRERADELAKAVRKESPELIPYRAYLHHALSSMQRSRYLAVCWSGCVLPVSLRSFDDGRRSDEYKEKWLRELEEKDIIRRKDGGFIWFHTDMRRAMRESFATIDNAYEVRAKIHLDLAGWFQKVFVATGSPAAIFEEVDHLCFSAESMVLHESFGTVNEFVVAARERIDSARNLLGENQFLIHSLGYPQACLRRLDILCDFWVKPSATPTPKSLVQKIGESDQELSERDELLKAIARFQAMTIKLCRNIAREIGDDGVAYSYHREFGLRLSQQHPVRISRIGTSRTSLDRYLWPDNQPLDDRPNSFYQEIILHNRTNDNALRAISLDECIEWWRWCAMLAIAARSFDKAAHSLVRALRAAVDSEVAWIESTKLSRDSDNPLEELIRELTAYAQKPLLWFNKLDKISPVQRRRVVAETLHSIELAGQVLLLKATTTQRLNALRQAEPTVDHEEQRRRAARLAHCGMELTYALVDCGIGEVLPEHELNWYKARFLMIWGLALDLDHKRRIYNRHSMGYMSDAAIYLQSSVPIRARADLALVELRRAEIRLQEASDIPLLSAGTQQATRFPQLHNCVFEAWTYDRLRGESIMIAESWGNRSANASQIAILEDLATLAKKPGNPVFRHLREVAARAKDALRFLDRAEPILRQRRRNVWWTLWYFERRMRAISYILWSTVTETNAPIPFLGLEASMRMTESEPDQILDNAIRMTRVDTYRLAMVMLNYASCARALQLRLVLDKDAVRLPERLKSMRKKLEIDGLTQLNKIILLRGEECFDGPSKEAIKQAQEFIMNVIMGLPQL